MAWGRGDFLAAGMIITILIIATLLVLSMLGAGNPTNNSVFPFR